MSTERTVRWATGTSAAMVPRIRVPLKLGSPSVRVPLGLGFPLS